MRPIDADELILKASLKWHVEDKLFETIKDLINEIPTLETNRKKGQWIYHIYDGFLCDSTMECNQCHAEQPLTCDNNFCPNCGSYNGESTDDK